MLLQADETCLTGGVIFDGVNARRDETGERIEWLLKWHLQKVADDPVSGGWETLYVDPSDGRFWERTYPQGDMHGGGPSQLKCLQKTDATLKYRVELLGSPKSSA